MRKNFELYLFGLLVVALAALAPDAYAARTKKVKYCNETGIPNREAVCASSVPSDIKYRPSLKECNGKAAAILSGPYLNAFSVVLRDKHNADRIPACKSAGNYGGCSAYQCNLGLSQCSAAKVGKTLHLGSGKNARDIYCFHERGDSKYFSNVTRMTIKRNIQGNLVRVQLNKLSSKEELN